MRFGVGYGSADLTFGKNDEAPAELQIKRVGDPYPEWIRRSWARKQSGAVVGSHTTADCREENKKNDKGLCAVLGAERKPGADATAAREIRALARVCETLPLGHDVFFRSAAAFVYH